MAIQQWSDTILQVDLSDDPQFTDEMNALIDQLSANGGRHVALNFADCTFINSSNLAKLLKLRKLTQSQSKQVVLCGISNSVWSVFLVTGLDKIFTFANDIATGLATLQLGQAMQG